MPSQSGGPLEWLSWVWKIPAILFAAFVALYMLPVALFYFVQYPPVMGFLIAVAVIGIPAAVIHWYQETSKRNEAELSRAVAEYEEERGDSASEVEFVEPVPNTNRTPEEMEEAMRKLDDIIEAELNEEFGDEIDWRAVGMLSTRPDKEASIEFDRTEDPATSQPFVSAKKRGSVLKEIAAREGNPIPRSLQSLAVTLGCSRSSVRKELEKLGLRLEV